MLPDLGRSAATARLTAPAHKASLLRQKDVFVARCLWGLRYSGTVALLRSHIKAGSQVNHIALDQQKTRAAGIDAPCVRVRYKGTVKHETILPK